MMQAPLAIDLFSGLGGWADGIEAEGWDVVRVDIEDMFAATGAVKPKRCLLMLQDVLPFHGVQAKGADLIVASPPCQEYSYMAMPWTRAKAKAAAIRADETGAELERLNRLFNACFRIQREACEAAGRYIPMVVENVRGAQPWVGRARFNYGSFYLWGDVPALIPIGCPIKVQSFRFDGSGRSFQTAAAAQFNGGIKNTGGSWFNIGGPGQKLVANNPDGRRTKPGNGARFTSRDCGIESRWFNDGPRSPDSISSSSSSSSSPRRKAASAQIAKIPFELSRHIARSFKPQTTLDAA